VRQTGVIIQSKNTTLDGVVSYPEAGITGKLPGVIVCHPHPLFGGNMETPLVVALCRGLNQAGFVTLRFNFRSVAAGQKDPKDTTAEQEDLEAALKMLQNLQNVDKKRLGLAGFSFGASVILKGLKRYKQASALAFISPPLPALDGSAVAKEKKPKLFVTGQMDKLVPVEKLMEKVGPMAEPVEYQMILGADHSWRGRENALAERVVRFFVQNMP